MLNMVRKFCEVSSGRLIVSKIQLMVLKIRIQTPPDYFQLH
jgi:hypothetical protein